MSYAKNPLQYEGTAAHNPPSTIRADRAPTSSDLNFQFNTMWIDTANDDVYVYSTSAAGVANWVLCGVSTSAVADVANGGTGLSTITDHGVMVGSGTDPVTPLAVGTNGQLLAGSTGADPVFATPASSDSSITWALGAGTIGATVTQATTEQVGGGETATDAEALAKTSDAKLVTPSNLAASGFLQWADVTLTAVQVKALNATPIELVAAPAAGATHMFMGAMIKLNYGSEVFTETADNLAVKYTNGSGAQVSQDIEMTGFIDQSADTITNALPKIDAIAVATGAEAQALVLHNLNDEIAGNASDDSTLTIRTYYVTHSL